MRSILYRASCPSSLELGEYHLAVLSKERAAFIKKHLKECSHCSLELQQLKTFLADVKPDLEYSLADRIKVWVAERLPEISSGALAPAFSLRGEEGDLFTYRAGEAELTLDVAPDPQQPDKSTLIGLLTGVAPDDLQASLLSEGRVVETVNVDELGNFIFSGLEPGSYDLVLSGPELEIHARDLEVRSV